MISAIYIMISFSFYMLIYIKSSDSLHPVALGSLFWFLAAAISSYTPWYDFNIQEQLSYETHFCIIISGIVFLLPGFFSRKKNKESSNKIRIIFTKQYYYIFNLIMILSVTIFFIRFGSVLLSPPGLAIGIVDLKAGVPPGIPFINYIDLFTPFAAVICYFEIKNNGKISRFRKWFLVTFIVFSLIKSVFFNLSRGDILVVALGVLYLYTRGREITFSKRSITIVVAVLTVFFYLGIHRLSETGRSSTQFGTGLINVILSQVYTYIAMNFQNLNLLINSGIDHTYLFGSWKFILKFFFSSYYDDTNGLFIEHSTLFFNAKTYLYFFYYDLGLLGVIVYPMLISVILTVYYNLSVNSKKYTLMLGVMMKAVLFLFFGNYFFGEFVILFPYLVVLLIILTIKTQIINISKI